MKWKRRSLGRRGLAVLPRGLLVMLAASAIHSTAMAQTKETKYSSARDWNLKAENLKPTGVNPYYHPLEPGFKYIMEKPESDEGYFRKEVVVLDRTEPFDIPGIGKFECAVVQEEEFFDGVYFQQSYNWYAIDTRSNSVYTFGEISWEIDPITGNKIFEGSWRAGVPDGNGVAEAGLLMPGTICKGAKYIYDGSESEALGGSEILDTGVTMETPAGTFKNCVRIRECDMIVLDDITEKVWAPNLGLVYDSSDGKLIASDALPGSDTTSFGKHHREPKTPVKRPVAKVTEKEAIAIAQKVVPGDVTSVSIERKFKKNVYVIETIAKSDGVETDVFVDIETGEVVGTDK